MKKFLKSGICGSVNSALTVAALLHETREEKKKKKNAETETRNPNGLIMVPAKGTLPRC